MKSQALKSNLFLLLAAAIWGLAFVAQRVGAKYVEPFTFNGVRFALGSLSLAPLILYSSKRKRSEGNERTPLKGTVTGGFIAGVILFIAASLQQIGLVDTSAGKAAFITGLYIVLVPVFGIFLKKYIRLSAWLGVAVALAGLYFLCITDSFTISKGDLFELAGAFFWAAHILVIDHFSERLDALKLSCFQFITCSTLSMAVALLFERITLAGLLQAVIPILYGGIFSVGIAYTLQVLGQKHAQPSHAAIILSMETVFASLGGLIILNENLGTRGYLGCVLMMCGILLSSKSQK